MDVSTLESFKARLCEEIATQLRSFGAGDVRVSPDRNRVVLELERAGEGPLRIVAGLNEDEVGRPGWLAWAQLRIETDDGSIPLITMPWRDAGLIEASVSGDLPLEARDLSAVLDRLRADFGVAARRTNGRSPSPEGRASSRALTRMDAPQRAVALVAPVEPMKRDEVVDAEFVPVAQATTARKKPRRKTEEHRLEEAEERIIGKIALDMYVLLVDKEKLLRGAGLLSSIEASVGRALGWAMVAAALSLELVLNRGALETLLGGGESLAYAAVGPFVIGGIGALADKWFHKHIVALPLAVVWACVIGWVISSDDSRLSNAQMLISKGETVQKRQEELDLALVHLKLAEENVKQLGQKLEAKGGSTVTAEIAALGKTSGKQSGAQRKAIREAAANDKQQDTDALAAERENVKRASEEVVGKKAAIRKAMLEDPSRVEASRVLFAVIGIINFASTFGMSLVWDQFMRRHAVAKADAQVIYEMRTMARSLRHNSYFQKSQAVAMLGPAKTYVTEEMQQEGRGEKAVESLFGHLEGEKIAARAAKRFAGMVRPWWRVSLD